MCGSPFLLIRVWIARLLAFICKQPWMSLVYLDSFAIQTDATDSWQCISAWVQTLNHWNFSLLAVHSRRIHRFGLHVRRICESLATKVNWERESRQQYKFVPIVKLNLLSAMLPSSWLKNDKITKESQLLPFLHFKFVHTLSPLICWKWMTFVWDSQRIDLHLR